MFLDILLGAPAPISPEAARAARAVGQWADAPPPEHVGQMQAARVLVALAAMEDAQPGAVHTASAIRRRAHVAPTAVADCLDWGGHAGLIRKHIVTGDEAKFAPGKQQAKWSVDAAALSVLRGVSEQPALRPEVLRVLCEARRIYQAVGGAEGGDVREDCEVPRGAEQAGDPAEDGGAAAEPLSERVRGLCAELMRTANAIRSAHRTRDIRRYASDLERSAFCALQMIGGLEDAERRKCG